MKRKLQRICHEDLSYPSVLHTTVVIYVFCTEVLNLHGYSYSYLQSDLLTLGSYISVWEFFTTISQSLPLVGKVRLFARNFIFHEIETQTMCFKSANRYQKLIIALEKLSLDFACDKSGSCLKFLTIS